MQATTFAPNRSEKVQQPHRVPFWGVISLRITFRFSAENSTQLTRLMSLSITSPFRGEAVQSNRFPPAMGIVCLRNGHHRAGRLNP